MLRSISDTLFLLALILLIVSAIVSGIGFQAFTMRRKDNDPSQIEVPNKQKQLEKQNKGMAGFIRSKITLTAVVFALVSVVLSYLERYV
ncbi:hypothetical protein P4H65_27010 [Paenibacillus chitinolyticus]|uniref:hypothetical protein n=1 Tax=Paenibacillus chitinolyticus TaxID=79263 RepID=UPI002DB57687|nr:hypothetical protein [Paenibacillus chitinolyticus]MEC0249435.1 hypothetical protein [Paenibacillus chitinolyticus]